MVNLKKILSKKLLENHRVNGSRLNSVVSEKGKMMLN
jgi:hypothetical protein